MRFAGYRSKTTLKLSTSKNWIDFPLIIPVLTKGYRFKFQFILILTISIIFAADVNTLGREPEILSGTTTCSFHARAFLSNSVGHSFVELGQGVVQLRRSHFSPRRRRHCDSVKGRTFSQPFAVSRVSMYLAGSHGWLLLNSADHCQVFLPGDSCAELVPPTDEALCPSILEHFFFLLSSRVSWKSRANTFDIFTFCNRDWNNREPVWHSRLAFLWG